MTAAQVISTLRVESVSVREDGTLGCGFAPRQNQIFGRHLLAPNASFEEGLLKFFLISFFYLGCNEGVFAFFLHSRAACAISGRWPDLNKQTEYECVACTCSSCNRDFFCLFFGLDADIWQQVFVGERDLATMCLFCAHLLVRRFGQSKLYFYQ